MDDMSKLKIYYEQETSQVVVTAVSILATMSKMGEWREEANETTGSSEWMWEVFFPNIQILLSVLAILPVSTAEADRSFSSIKRIKSFLPNNDEK